MGSVGELGAAVRAAAQAGPRPVRTVLVVGGGFAQRAWRQRVLSGLRGTHAEVAAHAGMPTPGSIIRLARQVAQLRPDVITAVGGGSVMDAAKCAAVLAGVRELDHAVVRRLCADGVDGPGIPVVAVPTTPGTGAEATPFATVWDRDGCRKLSMRGRAMLPVSAVLDPDLLLGLSRAQLASSVLDTLAQALEAAWSVRADSAAEALGRAALREISRLPARTLTGKAESERRSLMAAGHFSGQAIAISGTTLCHALSYPLTLRYGLRHGHACGITLSRVLEFNAGLGDSDCADPRGPERVREAIAGCLAALRAGGFPEVRLLVTELMAAGGLAPRIDVSAEEARALAADALGYDRAGNNPRRLRRHTVARLLAASP